MIHTENGVTRMDGSTGEILEGAIGIIEGVAMIIENNDAWSSSQKIDVKDKFMQALVDRAYSKHENKTGKLQQINHRTQEIRTTLFGN